MSAKLIQVIETKVRRGLDVIGDPARAVKQYWSPDGKLLAESDPCAGRRADPRILGAIQLLTSIRPTQAAIDEALSILRGAAP